MINHAITEEVLMLTFYSNNFPMATGIPLEKIKLGYQRDTKGIKNTIRKQEIKMVVIDGAIWLPRISETVAVVKNIRRKRLLNIIICIVSNRDLEIADTVWETDPTGVQKYLKSA